mgnify:CR=1 FL=1
MSETDDTDELLLIPPDLFAPNPDLHNLEPYYNVVDCLITQVNHLETRINLIESSSELSVSLISESPEMQSRKFSDEKTCSSSTQSTPQKPRTKFTMSSLPNSPDIEKLKKSPQKRILRSKKPEFSPMLGEIDSFLSNVKMIKRMNAVRNLENDFDLEGVNTKKLNMNQVNEMLREVELEDKKMERNVEKPCVKEKVWQAGDNVGSVPDYGYGARKTLYCEEKKRLDNSFERTDTDSSSESTQMTAFNKFSYKSKPNNTDDDFNLGLVSLAKLWKSNDLREVPEKFQQKLHEERLRRQVSFQVIVTCVDAT